MNILFNIAISLIASAVIFVGGMNIPASTFSLSSLKTPLFGAFTEITTATNLADFPTTYNANLNKTIEVGTTSVASITTLAGLTTANALTSASALETVGTLTTGSLGAGFTTVVVARGGTGSTTLSSNQVLLGNGTGNIGIVSGWGSSGQFLTSGGTTVAPTWTTSAVDQTLDYNWTGTSRIKNLHASSTSANPLVLNGVSINTPSTQGASSTVMSNNGSGTFYNVPMPWNKIGEVSFAGAATTTLTLTSTTTAKDLRITVHAVDVVGASCKLDMKLNPNHSTGYGANYAYWLQESNTANSATNANFVLLNNGNLASGSEQDVTIFLSNDIDSRKFMSWTGAVSASASADISSVTGGAVFNDTAQQLKSLFIEANCAGGGTITSGRITLYASQN